MPRGRKVGTGLLKLDKREILERYADGDSFVKIARSLGISTQTIYNRFKAWGFKPGCKHTRIHKTLKLRNKGYSVTNIAKSVGVSRQTVYVYLAELKEKGNI